MRFVDKFLHRYFVLEIEAHFKDVIFKCKLCHLKRWEVNERCAINHLRTWHTKKQLAKSLMNFLYLFDNINRVQQ